MFTSSNLRILAMKREVGVEYRGTQPVQLAQCFDPEGGNFAVPEKRLFQKLFLLTVRSWPVPLKQEGL